MTGTWNTHELEPNETPVQTVKGSFNTFGLGMNAYIGKTFGFYVVSGYKIQGVHVTRASMQGVDQNYIGNIKTTDLKYLNRGGFFNFGITIKLKNKAVENKAL